MFNFSSILDTYPNYIIERFDLSHERDHLVSVGEDFASIMNVVASSKYDLEMESIAKILKELSSDWEGDREVLLRHLVVNILVGNNDLHAKNMSLLKTYDSKTKEMVNCQLSPAYDIVCMEPSLLGLKNHEATHGMYLHGKRDFSLATLKNYAKNSLEFTEDAAKIIIGDACSEALKFASKLGENTPKMIKTSHPSSVTNIRMMCNFVHQKK
jgi:serine/threonine protein kinase HipA of HipAB toxin-antitoxin module